MSTDKREYEVAVLGGGPGGYTAAFRAADLGKTVCIIEPRGVLGGVCLNEGCIPSKTLLHGASVIEEARSAAALGIDIEVKGVNLDDFRNHKSAVTAKLNKGLAQLAKKRKVDIIEGYGSFTGQGTISVADAETEIHYKEAIIATGSRAFQIPGFPEDDRIWSSTEALTLPSIPKKLLIIGGGIIGLEMATVYHALGSEITIVELMDHIIPPADADLIRPLFIKLKKAYKAIYTKTSVTGLNAVPEGIEAFMEGKKAPEKALYDAVLVAVGRRPNSGNLGLENIGLAADEKGFIPVNERTETGVPGVYAIGDVTGNPMLAHRAVHQGKVAAEVIAGHKSRFSPATIPSVAYTHPEVAWMGATEEELKADGVEYDKGEFPWVASGRALSAGAELGKSKGLFDKKTGRILGAGICGMNAGELIAEAVLALEMGAKAEDIGRAIHAHPTLAETFAFTAEIVEGSITDL